MGISQQPRLEHRLRGGDWPTIGGACLQEGFVGQSFDERLAWIEETELRQGEWVGQCQYCPLALLLRPYPPVGP